jgi:hypothetical protein
MIHTSKPRIISWLIILAFTFSIPGCGGGGESSSSSSGGINGDRATPIYSVNIAWDPPTTNVDGSPLTDLAGYRLYYGTKSAELNNLIYEGTLPRCTISLPRGDYHFAVKAYDQDGNESEFSHPTDGVCIHIDATPSYCNLP